MKSAVVLSNPNIQGGVPCFKGTRVPVVAFFDYLAGGYTVDQFLEQFPSVTKEQATALLGELSTEVARAAAAMMTPQPDAAVAS
jgi:uncharacterized protein (DUF433 family)